MSEKLLDEISYVSDDGDVLPYADIEEPSGFISSTAEIEEPDDFINTTAEIESPERSEGYMKAEAIIQAGIEKSRGYGTVKVEYWVAQENSSNGGYTNRTSLAHFLAGNVLYGMVTGKEYKELIARYSAAATTDQAPEAMKSPDAPKEAQVRKIGNTAAAKSAPTYHSGHRDYRDIASARAGDNSLDN